MFQTNAEIHFRKKKVFWGWEHFNEIYPQIFLLTKVENGKARLNGNAKVCEMGKKSSQGMCEKISYLAAGRMMDTSMGRYP